MASLLLLTGATGASTDVLPSLALLGHVVRVLPLEAAPLLDAPPSDVILIDARRELASARQTCRLLRTTGTYAPAARRRHRRRPHRDRRRLGARRRRPRDLGSGRGRGPAAARDRTRRRRARDDVGHQRGDPLRRPQHRRGDLPGEARQPAARPHLQGVRAAEIPRPAPGPGLHPRPAAAGGLGLRLLRRHPHGRRARPAAARQARSRPRGADRHGSQRRLQVRRPGADRPACAAVRRRGCRGDRSGRAGCSTLPLTARDHKGHQRH